MEKIDMESLRVGRWTVGTYYGVRHHMYRDKNGKIHESFKALWNCVCDCGERRVLEGPSLRRPDGSNGATRSCGCLKNELSAARAKTRKRDALGRLMKKDLIGTQTAKAEQGEVTKCF